MPLEIQNLSELDAAKVAQMQATLTQLMQERHPEVELTRGAFHDLVLYFNSVLNAAVKENIDRVLQSNSLLSITQNPALAEPELVDAVLSNYNITRGEGVAAGGEATVILLQPETTTVYASVRFEADGVQFVPTQNFTILPPGESITGPGDVQMIAVGDGTYAANIVVVAENTGVEGNIKRGTTLTPDFPPNNTAAVYAASDFVNGAEPPTNEEYIAKLKDGLAAKTIGGRASYAALLRSPEAFPAIRHISVVGFGSPEQRRDQHSLFPISGGGRVDVYLQAYAEYQEQEHLLQATYIQDSDAELGTIWQIEVNKNVAPGFYEILRVARPDDTGATGYEVLLETRGFDFDDEDFVPDIIGREEGAYTKYQNAVIRFLDPNPRDPALVPLQSKALYNVRFSVMPLIKQAQDFLGNRDNRSRAADILVRAAVPCFTSLSFTIRKDAASSMPDLNAIRRALVAAIADVGFSGQLHSSLISGVVHRYLTGKQALGPIDMFGRILRPDGQNTFIRDNTILTIPDDPTRLITGNTTVFLVNEDDIAISVDMAGFTN